MPTFNRAYIISDAIQSVLSQSEPNWELIIVDGGSTDDTKQIIGRIDDTRIRYIFQANIGVAGARNRGLSIATGDCIMIISNANE